MMKNFKLMYFLFLFCCVATSAFALPNSWNVTENTGNYSNIGFLPEGNYTINGRNMAAGDAIGVFYTREAVQYCAGYLVWGEQYGLSVWGDDDQTPFKDGFNENETYIFKLWDNALQIEISDPNMNLNTGFGIYTINGMTTYNGFNGQDAGYLGVPILVSPANESVDIARCPTYSWQGVSTATSYELKVSTNPAFTAPGDAFTGSLSTTSYSLGPNQLPGAIYYWKVRAYRAGDGVYSDWSEVRSFQVVHVVPAVPQLNQPENATIGVMSPVLLSWQSAVDALQYQVQVSTSSSFATLAADKLTDNYMTSTGIANLTANTQYYWRVKSINTTRESDWSTVRQFTTALGTLTAPTLTAPADYATNQSTDITLTWNEVADATAYRVQLSTSNTFGNYLSNELVTNTQFTKTGLNNNTYYYWRVRAERGAEYGTWTTRRFTTANVPTLATPTITYPLNNAVDVPRDFYATWNEVADASFYEIQISMYNDFYSYITVTETVPSRHFADMDYNSTLYWRVRAAKPIGSNTYYSDWTSIHSFTITSNQLIAPTLVSPTNNATGIVPRVSLEWNAVPTATSYFLQIATDNSFSDIVNEVVWNDLSYIQNSLSFNQEYYWRVRARKGELEVSEWSETRKFTTLPALGVPTLTYPANNSIDLPATFTLQWDPVPGAEHYQINFSDQEGFYVYGTDMVDATSYQVNQQTYGSKTYWRVRAIRDLGIYGNEASAWSAVYNYKIVDSPFGTPVLVSPANNSTDLGFTQTLTWEPVANATSYIVRVSRAVDFTSYDFYEEVTGLNFEISGLRSTSTYFWSIRPKNAEYTGNWSEAFRFTTLTPPLGVPQLISPANNAQNLALNTVLSWEVVQEAELYILEVGTSPNFIESQYYVPTTITSAQFNNFTLNTTYYWRVKAMRGEESGAWSEVRSFTTLGSTLAAPILLTPISGSGNIAINPTLTWESVPTAESYIVQVAYSDSFSNPVYNSSANTPSISLNALTNGSTYYWRVKAVRGTTESSWSQVFNFATIPALPNAPILISPAKNATSVALNPTLQWNPVNGIGSYLVQVSTSNTFTENIVDEVVLTTSKAVANLQYATQYYWRVRSIETQTLMSNWSEVRKFTTISEIIPSTTTLNIGVLLQGAWSNNIHKEVAVTIELRKNNSGTTLNTSDLYKRVPVFINSDGIASANFDDIESGDYWIVVRASGYLAISSKLKQTIQSGSVVNYDFSTAIGNVYSASMLKSSNGRYLMKCGDLNNSKVIGSDDAGLLKGNSSSSTLVPSL